MWVVDVETNGAKQILDAGVVGVHTVDEVLVSPSDHHLQRGEHQLTVRIRHDHNRHLSGCAL